MERLESDLHYEEKVESIRRTLCHKPFCQIWIGFKSQDTVQRGNLRSLHILNTPRTKFF